jgi:hypothetical protein
LVDAANIWDEPLRLRRAATGPVVRVVLAEAAGAPGPLHYLLEGEGFQILGSASDDDALTRILSQRIEPEVIVVDAAVPATTVMVAQELAPGSEVIVIWPEGIAPPPFTDQVPPERVFEDLGPAVRRAAERNRLRHPADEDTSDPADVAVVDHPEPDDPAMVAGRTAARVLVGTVAVIASIIVTMGVSFALQGWRATHQATAVKTPAVTTRTGSGADGSSTGGATHAGSQQTNHAKTGCDAAHRSGANGHASTKGQQQAGDCPAPAGAGGQGSAHRHTPSGPNVGGSSGNGPGSGPGTGVDHGQGSGGQSTTHVPSDHPTGTPQTPASGDHAGP